MSLQIVRKNPGIFHECLTCRLGFAAAAAYQGVLREEVLAGAASCIASHAGLYLSSFEHPARCIYFSMRGMTAQPVLIWFCDYLLITQYSSSHESICCYAAGDFKLLLILVSTSVPVISVRVREIFAFRAFRAAGTP